MKNFLKTIVGFLSALGALSTPAGISIVVGALFIALLAFIIIMVVLFHQGAYERCIGLIGAWKGGEHSK